MNDIDSFERWLGYKVFSAKKRSAAWFLEQLGMRFLREYGYENCEEKALQQGWKYVEPYRGGRIWVN